jgi:hypothetical protein
MDRLHIPVPAMFGGLLTGVLCFSVLALVTGALGGCATAEAGKTVAVAIEVPQSELKAPIPPECDPSGRNKFPTVAKVPGATPAKNLAHAFTTAKSRDARNQEREHVCFCQAVRDHGSEAEKKVSEKACEPVWAKKEEKPTS